MLQPLWRWTAAASLAVVLAPAASPESATAKYFASIKDDPPRLLAFLADLPKGGDLHNHLSGAVYAESYARWAADDGLCVNTRTMALVAPPCAPLQGLLPAAGAFQDPTRLNEFIDGASMRHWDRSRNGHDQFFNAFAKVGAASGPPGDALAVRFGDMVAEVTARAAAEHVSYLELMLTPDGSAASAIGARVGWDPDLASLRAKLLAANFATVVAQARSNLTRAEARRRELLRCSADEVRLKPDATGATEVRPKPGAVDESSVVSGFSRTGDATPVASGFSRTSGDPGCDVTVRYIAQVSRSSPPQFVFAQMLAGFEEASAGDLPVVGLNLVAPEDNAVALRDFNLHMQMLEYLRKQYPAVHITLHAGELTEGLVPPESLRFHIRASVETAGATRIGHGVDVMYEDDPDGLLRELAAKHVLVEIALTSNDLILGVSGRRHPLSAYLRAGVPVALVSDDAGVARSTLTLEFRKAVEEQQLDYLTLKRLVKNSIAYAFVDSSTRAQLERQLGKAFTAFEAKQASRIRDAGVHPRSH